MRRAVLILCLFFVILPLSTLAQQPPAVKIKLKESGLYMVTQADLDNLGVDQTGVDPRNFRITNLGTEIPIRVIGEDDGRFDPGDEIEFYGIAIARDSRLFSITDMNVYWLVIDTQPGLRMVELDGTPGSGVIPTSFQATLHLEEDSTYEPTLPIAEGEDRWLWGERLLTMESQEFPFMVTRLSGENQEASVRVKLQGNTNDLINPDHHTQIWVNSCDVDDQSWDGWEAFEHTATVTASCLQEGQNILKLENVGDTGATVDSLFMNGFEVDYWRSYRAEGDLLEFTGQGPETLKFQLANFSQSNGEVYEITDPDQVHRMINTTSSVSGSSYTLSFTATLGQETRRYLALTPEERKKPLSLVLDSPSMLMDPANGADYIIIAHEAFVSSVQPLAAHREKQGLRVIVADVTDVYDEFSSGISDPQAIKDFLQHAFYNWVPPAPLYVLLVGDATINFKYVFLEGSKTYVPTHFFETYDGGEAPDDNWFVTISGDDPLPDMFIGRIPVTEADVDIVISKILNYENQTSFGWESHVQFVADDDDPIFESVSSDLAALFPSGYNVDKVFLSEYTFAASAKGAILDNINQGSLISTFTGHGSGVQWADEELLVSDDADLTTNGQRLTFLVTLNCANGYFTRPFLQVENRLSLAEAFVKAANGGAIAAWAPTWLGFTSDHYILAQKLFETIWNENNTILGAATTKARIAALANGASDATVNAFILFGDPASALAYQPIMMTTTSPLPNGKVDSAYDVLLEATGGVAPYTWSLASGMLPPGLTLDPDTGILSGIPTASETALFDVMATDPNGVNGKRTFTLTVNRLPDTGDTGGSDSGVGGGGGGGGGWRGGCFIATAAFGSPLEPQVQILREFRDQYLQASPIGRRFVAFYYTVSPPLAELIARHEILQAGVRIGLLPVLGMAFLVVRTTLWMKLFFLLTSLILLVWKMRMRT